ncbi:MAG: phenylalanine--tRNA ligase subunit beta, partial [Streptosporangiaceae bacterium]
MLVPLSWLLEYVALDEPADAGEVARRLTAVGLEIESIEQVGQDIAGVVIARVLEIEELAGYRKPIRYCRVTTGGPDAERSVICGAVNFAAGDLVPLAVPGAVLPGGFEIRASELYGKVSDGMICSASELGLGDDHSGIMVLPADAPLGAGFAAYAGLRDVVLDVNVTPDKGHALSIRGLARELASAFGVAFTDPADAERPAWAAPGADGPGEQVYQASIGDPAACDRFALREVRGIDPGRPTPLPMVVRLARADTRSVSLAVDITNYVMLELGRPIHGYDADTLTGTVGVRRAAPGERLTTLDGVDRELAPEDLVVVDDSGVIGLGGVMGGEHTEISAETTRVLVESAHWDATAMFRTGRRHKITSEAGRRNERGVDPAICEAAADRVVELMVRLGGASADAGVTVAGAPPEPTVVSAAADLPARITGMDLGTETAIEALRVVGC